jgi:hypothetical protein
MRCLTIICLTLASFSTGSAQMSHEEIRVRTAYAKLTYAVEQGVVGELACEAINPGGPVREQYAGMTKDQRMAAVTVTFMLSDFVIGDAKEIVNHKLVDLITPDWDLVDVLSTDGNQGMNYNDNGLATGWKSAEMHWKPTDPTPLEKQVLLSEFTLAQVYQVNATRGDLQSKDKPLPEGLWKRYASYSVTVTFQEKTRSYKSLFLFGTDSKGTPGNEQVTVYDPVVGSGLQYAMTQPLFPEAFVVTHLRTLPIVTNWLQANQMSGPNCSTSAAKGDVCCDLVKLKCGPKSEDVAAGFAKPLPDGSLLKKDKLTGEPPN